MNQRVVEARQPRYVQVANDLRAMIAAGSFDDGATIPTESALCARYAVSRFTVREALRRLQAEGMILRRRGSGTVVANVANTMRQSFADLSDLVHYTAGSSFAFEVEGAVTLSPARAATIGALAQSRWICVSGVRRLADSLPIATIEVLINPILEAYVGDLRHGPESLFSQLERLSGCAIARIKQEISAIGAGGREADLLGVRSRSPCLRIVRTYIDKDGESLLIANNVHAGDRFTFSMNIDN